MEYHLWAWRSRRRTAPMRSSFSRTVASSRMRLAAAHPLRPVLLGRARLQIALSFTAAALCFPCNCLTGRRQSLQATIPLAARSRIPRQPASFAQSCCTREGGAHQGSQWPVAVREWPTHTHSNWHKLTRCSVSEIFNRPRPYRRPSPRNFRDLLVPLKRPTTHAYIAGPPYDSAMIKYLRFDCDARKGVLRRFGEATHLFIWRRSVVTQVNNSFTKADFSGSTGSIICSTATPNRLNIAILTPLCRRRYRTGRIG
jgi:hypothetical protein